MNPDIERRIQALEQWKQSLQSANTIPLDVDGAVRDRFKLGDMALFRSTTKTVGSETQAVDEAGASSYSVPKLHDGYVENTFGGVTIYLPYYT